MSGNWLRTSVIGLTLALFPPVVSAAQEGEGAAATSSSTYLDTVVVTAGRAEEQVKSVSRALTVITKEEIQRRNTQDLLGLLKHHGVQINEYNGGGGATLTMRGFHTPDGILSQSNVLVLLDGRRAGLEYVSMVPMQNLERVEIIKGAASLQYGPEAIGGVVNLITKRGDEKTSVALEQSYGSYDAVKTQVAFSGRADKVDYSAGGSFAKSGDYKIPDGKTFPNTGVPQKFSGIANIGYNFNEDNRLGLIFSGYDGTHGYSNQLNPVTGTVTNPDGRGYRKNHSFDLWYEGGLPDTNLKWQARYFQGETSYEMDSNWPNRMRTTGAYGHWYQYRNTFQGAQAQTSWNNNLLYLTAGLDYYTADYNKWVWHVSPPPDDAGKTDTGGYLLAKLAFFNDTLWFNGGLRYGQYEVEVKDVGGVNVKQHKLTPGLGVAYLPFEWLKLRANYAESFKMPEPQNIAYNFISSSTGDRYIPNPDLKPETAKTWEIGADLSYKGAALALTYFSTDHTDEAVAREVTSIGGTRTMQYQNMFGTTRYRGLEFSLDWSMGETFQWDFDIRPYVSLTKMLKYELPEIDARTGYNKAYFRADLMMSYGLSFSHPGWGLTSSLDITYSGERLAPASWSNYGEISPDNKWGKFTVVDFHIAKDLYKWKNDGRLILKADVLNVFNTDHYQQVVYRLPGRSFVVGLRYEY